MTHKSYLFIALCCAWLWLPVATQGQVKIGESTPPEAGAVLDLKTTTAAGYLGGLLLPHAHIVDLGFIPADFTDADKMAGYNAANGVDTNTALTGMIVYNTNPDFGVGTYVWDGETWLPLPDVVPPLPGAFGALTCGTNSVVVDKDTQITSGNTFSIPYSGMTGATIVLADNLDLGAEINGMKVQTNGAQSFSAATGNVLVKVVGTPTTAGTTVLSFTVGGETCTITVNVLLDTSSLPAGSGKLAGRTCFDIAENICEGIDITARASNKTNFADRTQQGSTATAPYSGVQDYVFTAVTTNVSNVRYQLAVTGGAFTAAQLIDAATPMGGTLHAGALTNGTSTTLTINFKDDLNSLLANVSRDDAAKIRLTIIYDNDTQDVKVETVISIMDCACCGAFVAENVFKVFMCHNLGADESRDPFTAHRDLHGHFYKWGTGQVALSAYDNINGTTGTISNWSSRGGTPPNTSADWDMSTANPCPAGYRVPTITELAGVANTTWNPRTNAVGGSWTAGAGNWTNGVKYGPALFLPAAGYRAGNGSLTGRGSHGYYWSSTSASAMSNANNLYVDSGGQNLYVLNKSQGYSVRCIAE